LTGAAAIDLKQEKEQISLLEEALSKDMGREKIYSDKLGRWVYARLKDTKKI
jgi:Amt family ammonium transporter